jgi:hypothetical protein
VEHSGGDELLDGRRVDTGPLGQVRRAKAANAEAPIGEAPIPPIAKALVGPFRRGYLSRSLSPAIAAWAAARRATGTRKGEQDT